MNGNPVGAWMAESPAKSGLSLRDTPQKIAPNPAGGLQSQEDRHSCLSFLPDRNVWPPDFCIFAVLPQNPAKSLRFLCEICYNDDVIGGGSHAMNLSRRGFMASGEPPQ
ncbi:MAG: hypothetical protein IT426_13340 [Pirellulales bacterium]|nr:hypothetical protein [Pirellulales bacterium]